VTETLNVVASEIPGPVGVEFRADRRSHSGRQDDWTKRSRRPPTASHARIPVLLHHAGDPAGDRRQPRRDALELSDVLRKRAQMNSKIRAMSSESKASAYIVGALPFIVFA